MWQPHGIFAAAAMGTAACGYAARAIDSLLSTSTVLVHPVATKAKEAAALQQLKAIARRRGVVTRQLDRLASIITPVRDATLLYPRRALRGKFMVLHAAELRPAALARELGRAAQQDYLVKYHPIFRRVAGFVMPGTLVMPLSTSDETAGRKFSVASSLLALPAFVADAGAARRGFQLMREVGMSRVAALRCFASSAFSASLVAAPLVGHFIKRYAGGYSSGGVHSE